MITIAILTALYSDAWRAHEAAAWSAVSMLLLYCFCFGVSWGPVPWAMPAELFSQSTRAKGVAIAVLSNWSNNAWVGFGTPPLIQRTDFGTFLFFGGECDFQARVSRPRSFCSSCRLLLHLVHLGALVRARGQGSPSGAARCHLRRQLRRGGSQAHQQDPKETPRATRCWRSSLRRTVGAVPNIIFMHSCSVLLHFTLHPLVTNSIPIIFHLVCA